MITSKHMTDYGNTHALYPVLKSLGNAWVRGVQVQSSDHICGNSTLSDKYIDTCLAVEYAPFYCTNTRVLPRMI